MNRDILLARRDRVRFVARSPDRSDPRAIPADPGHGEEEMVVIPVSQKEHAGAPLAPADSSRLPVAAPRPDILRTLVTPLLTDPGSITVTPSHEGLRVVGRAANGDTTECPVAARDALGFLAALLGTAPRGVIDLGHETPPRVLIATRPSDEAGALVMRVASAAGPAPENLADSGLSPALLERLLEAITRGPGAMIVTGSPGSGRTTTLGLIASAMIARGMKGVNLVPPGKPEVGDAIASMPRREIPWARLDTLPREVFDFVVLDAPAQFDRTLVTRLASTGRVVIATCPAADPVALVRSFEDQGRSPVRLDAIGCDLVRTVCPDCTTWRTLPIDAVRRYGFHRRDLDAFTHQGGLTVPAGEGCSRCAGTGTSGITGVFEHAANDIGEDPLPRMREDGWIKVVQGQALSEDVVALPGAGRPMRPVKECVDAAQSPKARPTVPAEPRVEAVAATGPERSAAAEAEVPEDPGPMDQDFESDTPDEDGQEGRERATPAMALQDAERLAHLLEKAHEGHADRSALEALLSSLEDRASGREPVIELIAPSRGFHPTRHMVNTALLAARIGRCMEDPLDPTALVRLGLLHDIGLVSGGIDPGNELPATISKESIDQNGARTKPAALLRAFGIEDPNLEDAIRRVHRVASHAEEDPTVAVVALASLLDMASRGQTAGRPLDVHDATCLVMERHARSFSRFCFRALLHAVPIYPVGALVELSNGDLACIVALNDDNPFRPRVEIRLAGGGKGLPGRRVVDLARAPFLHIRHRVAGSETAGTSAG